MKVTDWTAEKINELTKRWQDGESSGVIADEMGITRMSVIGKIRRLGIHRHQMEKNSTPMKQAKHAPTRWTPERDAALRQCWSQKVPRPEIAKILGASVEAICKRERLLRLSRRENIGIPFSRPVGRPRSPHRGKPVIPDNFAPKMITFKELRGYGRDCRFPIDTHEGRFFCGLVPAADNEPYCQVHRAICWNGKGRR